MSSLFLMVVESFWRKKCLSEISLFAFILFMVGLFGLVIWFSYDTLKERFKN